MNKKSEQRLASNRRILDSAFNEFAEKGYSRALLGNIAREAGVSNGMITQRFGGKENLYNSVFDDLISSYISRIESGPYSLHHMLYFLIQDMKAGARYNTKQFRFVYDLLFSRDSPVNSFDRIEEMFEKSSLCMKMKEAMEAGYIKKGDPFELIKSFLVSVVGITKVFNDSSVSLPDTESYMTLLLPREQRRNMELDGLRARLSDELIGQLSSEYEAVLLFNLESNMSAVGKKSGMFLELDPPDRDLSFDEKTRIFAETAIHPDYREYFIEFFKTERLLKLFESGKTETMSFRTVDPHGPFYQATVRFNQVDSDGHWITLGIKNTDRVLQEEIRSAVTAAEGRMNSFTSMIASRFEFVTFLDLEEDCARIYKLEGEFSHLADKVKDNRKVNDFLNELVGSLALENDRDQLRSVLRKMIRSFPESEYRIPYLSFEARIGIKTFRCLLELASVSEDHTNLVIALMDSDKSLIKVGEFEE